MEVPLPPSTHPHHTPHPHHPNPPPLPPQVPGVSADKAHALISAYPTPAALIAAYARLGPALRRDGPGMLAGLAVPRQRNRLGPAVSAAVYEAFNRDAALAPAAIPHASREMGAAGEKKGA